MSSTPARAVKTSGRSNPCVSEMSPISRPLGSLGVMRGSGGPLPLPARDECLWNPELVEHSGDDEVHEIADAARAMVKCGGRREDHGPGPAQAEHVLQMDRAQRSFARDEDQPSPLLEGDIRRPLNERSRCTDAD